MKLSEILIHVPDIKDILIPEPVIRIKIGGQYLIFRSEIMYVKYVRLYLAVNNKISTFDKSTLEAFYDTDIGDLPSIEEQINYVVKWSCRSETTLLYHKSRYDSVAELVKYNLRFANRVYPAARFESLVKITNEDLFREHITNYSVDNHEQYITMEKPELMRPEYLLYYMCFMYEEFGLYLGTPEISNYGIKIPPMKIQDIMIRLYNDYVCNKKIVENFRRKIMF